MLNNYFKDSLGVVHQMGYDPFPYDEQYIYKNNSDMSFLRLGFMLSVIPPEGSLLDVGFGDGQFLRAADSCFIAYGMDCFDNPNLPETAEPTNDIFFPYDVITFFDSLEHFISLSFVPHLKAKHVVISMPECHYPNDEWFENWKHRKPNEHLHHFSRDALIKFMTCCNYSCEILSNPEDVIRRPTDSYSNIMTGIFRKQS